AIIISVVVCNALVRDEPTTAEFHTLSLHDALPILLSNVAYSDSPYECAQGADALVIVTEWEQFRALDFDALKRVMVRPVVVDLRDRKSTRLNSSHQIISYAVFCLKKKK